MVEATSGLRRVEGDAWWALCAYRDDVHAKSVGIEAHRSQGRDACQIVTLGTLPAGLKPWKVATLHARGASGAVWRCTVPLGATHCVLQVSFEDCIVED